MDATRRIIDWKLKFLLSSFAWTTNHYWKVRTAKWLRYRPHMKVKIRQTLTPFSLFRVHSTDRHTFHCSSEQDFFTFSHFYCRFCLRWTRPISCSTNETIKRRSHCDFVIFWAHCDTFIWASRRIQVEFRAECALDRFSRLTISSWKISNFLRVRLHSTMKHSMRFYALETLAVTATSWKIFIFLHCWASTVICMIIPLGKWWWFWQSRKRSVAWNSCWILNCTFSTHHNRVN